MIQAPTIPTRLRRRPTAAEPARAERPFELKSRAQIEMMRAAGRVVAETIDRAGRACVPGVRTGELNDVAIEVVRASGAVPIFRGYRHERHHDGFPADVCVSINEEVVHGVPGPRVIREGDLVTIDCGVSLDGWCADAARTFAVGDVGSRLESLVTTTRRILADAIAAIRPGRRWSGIARDMHSAASDAGFEVVRSFVGHGIGRRLHEQPQVPASASPTFERLHDFVLQAGMTLAIEPILTPGTGEVRSSPDGWTVVTADGAPACHEEHTVAVTHLGAVVLTEASSAS